MTTLPMMGQNLVQLPAGAHPQLPWQCTLASGELADSDADEAEPGEAHEPLDLYD